MRLSFLLPTGKAQGREVKYRRERKDSGWTAHREAGGESPPIAVAFFLS